MPRIFDNIDDKLLDALNQSLPLSYRADFCVGYFNLRGWRMIDKHVEQWPGGDGQCARVLIGMQSWPQDELYDALSLLPGSNGLIDNARAIQLKREAARNFRDQLMRGAPTNADEAGLRRLSRQLKAGQVVVKLHTRHQLHAKLYLLHEEHPSTPITGYLGSSNLTLAGLRNQGELNVDVTDYDACLKLQQWFDNRWSDRFSLDISSELAEIIDESWAREEQIPPYHIYLKIAYHLSEEAREGLAEFRIPPPFDSLLFDYQKAAVQIAARHLNRRGGVMIGDVVGLGKTMMATALAKINEFDTGHSTLIICPKNLERMWNEYRLNYGLAAEVVPLSVIENRLDDIPARFRLVLIDESHNLRNREGQRYRAIQEYIQQSGSRAILLTATPYNKSYTDLGSQLRLFIDEHEDLGIRPENYIREITEVGFIAKHQAPVTSLAAFEQSQYADDWRELMRLFLVRRTRSFIINNYAETDPLTGRKYLTFSDGMRSYFPERVPKTLTFAIDEADSGDAYARMFSGATVDAINRLYLPRYGLGNYIREDSGIRLTAEEQQVVNGLNRAGRRLMGFTRTNLFKRLESSGPAFIQSLDRHILRNFVFIHALEQGLPIPIGTQGAELLDPAIDDEDPDLETPRLFGEEHDDLEQQAETEGAVRITGGEAAHRQRATEIYEVYATRYRRRFKWLRAGLMTGDLREQLLADARELLNVLAECGNWQPEQDEKLNELTRLLTAEHHDDKVLVFSQFADTVRYVADQLKGRGIEAVEAVSGDSADPTALAERFSPVSNEKRDRISPSDELRVLISTDVLSEGQNLQDSAIVVNYDLPWAIIRLVQRAGRVDRIGQTADEILCYSFLPADGIERLINLRGRIVQRLEENAEVVGADEAFFEDGDTPQTLFDLYNEKAGILDDDADDDTDLASQALEIWRNATGNNSRLENAITTMPDVVYSTREQQPGLVASEGAIVYMKTSHDTDALALVGWDGQIITQSQTRILELAACGPDTQSVDRHPRHHEAVEAGVKHLSKESNKVGGQLGRPSGARFQAYTRLQVYAKDVQGQIFSTPDLKQAIDDLYRYPLQQRAVDTINRLRRSGADNQQLAEAVTNLRSIGHLSIIQDNEKHSLEPRIICSLGLNVVKEKQ